MTNNTFVWDFWDIGIKFISYLVSKLFFVLLCINYVSRILAGEKRNIKSVSQMVSKIIV